MQEQADFVVTELILLTWCRPKDFIETSQKEETFLVNNWTTQHYSSRGRKMIVLKSARNKENLPEAIKGSMQCLLIEKDRVMKYLKSLPLVNSVEWQCDKQAQCLGYFHLATKNGLGPSSWGERDAWMPQQYITTWLLEDMLKLNQEIFSSVNCNVSSGHSILNYVS